MPVRDGAASRKERLSQLISLVEKTETDIAIGRKRLVSLFMLQSGLRPERIEEYLDQLIDAEVLYLVDGRVLLHMDRLSKKVAP